MEKEEMEKLGFTDDVSWETEEAEKKFLFEKIQNLKQKAYTNARTQAEAKRQQQEQSNKPPEHP